MSGVFYEIRYEGIKKGKREEKYRAIRKMARDSRFTPEMISYVYPEVPMNKINEISEKTRKRKRKPIWSKGYAKFKKRRRV